MSRFGIPKIDRSASPEASVVPSGENATELIQAICSRVAISRPVSTSHSLTVPSIAPEAIVEQSGEKATEMTQ